MRFKRCIVGNPFTLRIGGISLRLNLFNAFFPHVDCLCHGCLFLVGEQTDAGDSLTAPVIGVGCRFGMLRDLPPHSRIDVDTRQTLKNLRLLITFTLQKPGELALCEQRGAAELLIFHSDHLLHLAFEIGLLCPRLTGFQKSQSPFLFLEFAGGFVSRPM